MNQTPKHIRRLSERVINQLNAGEVVERPSNVVKELIENSLDAGATQIEISLKGGGIAEITVQDNGSGIPTDEIGLAVERHATSKIAGESDLEAVVSFGFRGEALASIAAVSNLSIKSATDSESGGAQVSIDFGSVSSPAPVAMARGTSVTVRDLFAKVPARRKFLRAPQTELAHIARVVRETALAHPEVLFRLYHEGQTLHTYPVNEPLSRFWACMKPAWEPLHIQEMHPHIKMEAFLSPPGFSEQRSEVFLFINKRPVRNRTLLAAIRNAYLDVLGKGHEPSGAVYLQMDYTRVDVNAHPQKLEVRVLEQEKLYAWLYQTVKKHLEAVKGDVPAAKPETDQEKCVGRIGDRYMVYVDEEGIRVLDPKASDGREKMYRLGLAELERHFNP